jgi:hypothetical protein
MNDEPPESRPCDRLEKFTKVAATTILPSGHELPPPAAPI